jgi:Squalene-hopene cyclase C-terminal domain
MRQQFVQVRPENLRRGSLALAARMACGMGLSLALALLFSAAVAAARPSGPASPAHGHVIVQFADRDLVARAITFTAPASGLQALELSGLEVITTSTAYGPVVCSIEGVGCPADNCFCDPDRFWNYNYWDGAAWQGYLVGAGASTLDDGAVEGWRWGKWGSAMWPAQPVTAALHALDWLRPLQSATNGGYGSDGGAVEMLLAAGANGYRAADWRLQSGAPSLAGYLVSRAAPYSAQGAAQAGKLAVGMVATGACWPRMTTPPGGYYDAASGAYATGAGPQAWAMLGAAALGENVPPKAMQYLEGLAQPDGGWEWGPGWGTDTNTAALALQALLATGEPPASAPVAQGLAYLKAAQNADGGFPYAPGSLAGAASDANSTAYVVQALRSAGEDPAGPDWNKGQADPIRFLLSLQRPNGAFEWQKGTGASPLATQQALVALLGRSFPLRTGTIETCASRFVPVVSR